MSPDEFSNVLQSIAILAAVIATIAGFVIARQDRNEARRLAARNHAASVRHAHLLFQLDALSRLAANLNQGGSSNSEESKRLGAEALTLIGLLDSDLLPTLWEERVGDEEKLQSAANQPGMPGWKLHTIETQLAINKLLKRIDEEMKRDEL